MCGNDVRAEYHVGMAGPIACSLPMCSARAGTLHAASVPMIYFLPSFPSHPLSFAVEGSNNSKASLRIKSCSACQVHVRALAICSVVALHAGLRNSANFSESRSPRRRSRAVLA